MRKLRLIGMTLLMVIVCTSFCACSSNNDDDDNGDVKVEEKTVTVNLVEGSSDKLTDNLLIYKLTSNDEAEVVGNNGSVVSVVIPTKISWGGNTYKVTKIEDKAFYRLETLTSVTIPSSIKILGNDAFYECRNLATTIIANGLTTIEGGAFFECSSLTSFTIPNSVTTIEEGAFNNCENLTSITIGSSLTSLIGLYIDSKDLASINVDAANLKYSSVDGVLFNKNKTSLLIMPNNHAATNYTIPSTVTTIGQGAFEHCANLTSITIPNSVATIGNRAFAWLSLTSITIPNSVTTIGDLAFEGCSSLSSITIPNSVTTIGYCAFDYCTSLKDIYMKSTTPPEATDLGDCYESTTLHVPSGCKAIYNSKTSPWRYFYNIVES